VHSQRRAIDYWGFEADFVSFAWLMRDRIIEPSSRHLSFPLRFPDCFWMREKTSRTSRQIVRISRREIAGQSSREMIEIETTVIVKLSPIF